MRLEPDIPVIIREEVLRFDPSAEIWLFGSRTNDRALGGDIDLLLVSESITFADQLRLRIAILDRIGWQQLDLLVRRRAQLDEPIVAEAMDRGIKL